jgi:hypothetical protein
LRRGAAGHELLSRALQQAAPEFETRRVRELRLTVSADRSSANAFLIVVTNTGPHPYEALRIGYERLLLHAEHFGLDSTHMPDNVARKEGPPLVIDVLAPGKAIEIVRSGYGTHDEYDGPRETVLDLAYRFQGREFAVQARRWADVTVVLPNARENY